MDASERPGSQTTGAPQFDSFREFFPYYLSEHRDPFNRGLHYVGTVCAAVLLVFAVLTGQLVVALLVPVIGYGPAWVGHFLVEGNRPATFRHPLWSLMGDVVMLGLAVTGQLQRHLAEQPVPVTD